MFFSMDKIILNIHPENASKEYVCNPPQQVRLWKLKRSSRSKKTGVCGGVCSNMPLCAGYLGFVKHFPCKAINRVSTQVNLQAQMSC